MAENTGFPDYGPVVEPSPRWVRVKVGGEVVADSRETLLLREYARGGRLPTYFFPADAVRTDLLEPASHENGRRLLTLRSGDKKIEGAAWTLDDPKGELAPLDGMITFAWDAPGVAWYEEEERALVHARDPYKRVDVIPSSRHVRIEVDGVTVADSTRPHLLFETSLPTRYYLPREDVHMEYLEPTDLHTRCPYKGLASYWSVRVGDTLHEDLVWSYPNPIPEAPKIRELMAFYNERVDIYVDGELEERPRTQWS